MVGRLNQGKNISIREKLSLSGLIIIVQREVNFSQTQDVLDSSFASTDEASAAAESREASASSLE